MNVPAPRLRLSVGLPVLTLLAGMGCGYSFEPLSPPGIRAVEVPLFRNETRRREMEYLLTEAVARELRLAGWRIAPPGAGDAVLHGTLAEVDEGVLSEDPSGAVAESSLTVTVTFRLEDDAGRIVAEGRVAETAEVVYARGEDRPQGLQGAAVAAAQALVRRLERRPGDAGRGAR